MPLDFSKILSKSDFKTAMDCPAKLYYKKNGYPSANDGNEYVEYLAEAGYIVGKMATLYFPDGIRIDNSKGIKSAIEQTSDLINKKII